MSCPTVSRTATYTITAIILPKQETDVPSGKYWLLSYPCTETETVPAIEKMVPENALRQNI